MGSEETRIYIAALIAAGVLAVILLFFIITIIRQQRRTKRLHQEKILAEILTMEKERSRIAADLHDDLGPILSAVRFKVNAVDLSSPEDHEIIKAASAHIDEALTRIREITFDLMPNTLTRKGLVQTVEEFIPRAEKLLPMKINFAYDSLPPLPAEQVIHLYRIIQEIIHNVIKHSRASMLTITLRVTGKDLRIFATDNGIGFNHDSIIETSNGLGLKNLVSRVEILHGEFRLSTAPGKGVIYDIIIPLTQTNEP